MSALDFRDIPKMHPYSTARPNLLSRPLFFAKLGRPMNFLQLVIFSKCMHTVLDGVWLNCSLHMLYKNTLFRIHQNYSK